MTAHPPERLGPYELLTQVGEGGMGSVFRARHSELDRDVAIKFPRLDATANAELLAKRFKREGSLAARLRHPHLVALHEVGEHEGRPYLVMEWVDGESLADHLERDGPFSIAEAVTLVRKIAQALHYMHTASVLHRDVKPANILLSSDRSPRLTDFGLAKDTRASAEGRTQLTRAGAALGTPAYAAPEQLIGDLKNIGPATDVFGLGATLFALLTGQPPRDSVTLRELLAQPIPPPSSLREEIPPELDAICARCLDMDVTARFRSAQALADRLVRFELGLIEGQALHGARLGDLLSEAEANQHRPPSPTPTPPPPERASGRPLLLTAALALALVAVSVWAQSVFFELKETRLELAGAEDAQETARAEHEKARAKLQLKLASSRLHITRQRAELASLREQRRASQPPVSEDEEDAEDEEEDRSFYRFAYRPMEGVPPKVAAERYRKRWIESEHRLQQANLAHRLHWRALHQWLDGDLSAAEGLLRESHETNGSYPLARLDLAEIAFRQGRLDAALVLLDAVDGEQEEPAPESIALRKKILAARR